MSSINNNIPAGLPINLELLTNLQAQLSNLDQLQLSWLSGYFWALAQQKNSTAGVQISALTTAPTKEQPTITIISASQTGNASNVAKQMASKLQSMDINAKLFSAKDYKVKNLTQERLLLLITSTQGDGEPPEEGIVLYKYLFGKKAPNLSQLEFAVFALGDSSYPDFCQAGKDFDHRLAELGAKRLFDRVDADLAFESMAEQWQQDMASLLADKVAASANIQNEALMANGNVDENKQDQPSPYNKNNPFPATLLIKQKITAKQSEKDIRHFEFDLSGSDLSYQPGDALGIWFKNDPKLIANILEKTGLTGEELVFVDKQEINLNDALLTKLEITQNTPNFVQKYAEISDNKKLKTQLAKIGVQNFIQQIPLAGVINDHPYKLTAQQLVDLLRPLTPRLYSIASSQKEVGDEVHLTVAVVRYHYQQQQYNGGASSYLADRVEEDQPVSIFIEKNDNFRLPENTATPIIMIGSGTGIAPFRAFLQEREAQEAEGKNWLIFGNQRFIYDFLYQVEWQQLAKNGYLNKISLAWSRDQKEKIYVSHKIREQGQELWQWLQQGAIVYVCGSASTLAKDVEQALLDVIVKEGKLASDDAEEYLNDLRESNCYQRDVY